MKPSLSVVLVVYNGEEFLKKSLPALAAAVDEKTEIIIVDDGSTDNSNQIEKQFEAKIITLISRTGAANARNVGARAARGDIILFVDSDVVVKTDTIQHLRSIISEHPEFSAFFGSYDDAPEEADFLSQYRNLMHHFFHQTGNREAETFWSGFGAIKREVFHEVGGFDEKKFKVPSVEDIELGYRLRARGHRILLIPELQAKHLKKWTFYSILRTDFWQRAVPWAEIILFNPKIKHELNTKNSQKISAFFVGSFLLFLVATFRQWQFILPALASLTAVILINFSFYSFFIRCRGLTFTLGVLPMHLLYFLYGSAAFLYSWLNIKILRRSVIVR